MIHHHKVSMKDVAALAGVSIGTVSNVINSPDMVADKTRRKVELAIDKLGWIPNESARSLRAGRSRSVGVVIMDIGNPFFTDVVLGAEDAVTERGYSAQVGNSAHDTVRETAQLQMFAKQPVGGVLFAPVRGLNDTVRQLRSRGVPVVILDRAGQQSEFCSVSVDDVEGGRIAVQHLIDQGHRHIAVVGGQPDIQQVRDRRIGADLAARGHADVRLNVMSSPHLDVESGVEAGQMIALMAESERPTGVFAVNDLLAIGLLQGFVTAGLRVPNDVAIIGYDDITFAAAAAVPLSSVRQPKHDLGYRAAELLFEEIAALDEGAAHEHVQVHFTPELVIRRSSAVPAPAPTE